MKTVGMYEAKTHLGQLLDEVERGQCVVITRYGRPIARLVPEQPAPTSDSAAAIIDKFAAFREDHRGALSALEIRTWIEAGRKY